MVQVASPVRFTGQLVPYAEGLRRFLLELGYTPASASQLLRLGGHLGRWLDRRSLHPSALTSGQVARFVRARRRAGFTQFVSIRSLRPILAYLSSAGAIPAVVKAPLQPDLLGRYVEYLDQERGLAAPTISSREHFTKRFLLAHPDVGSLTAGDVTGFLLGEVKRYAVSSAKVLTTALRSFLRYLYVTDQVKVDFRGAVPAVAGWRLTGLPKALAPDDVDRLLRTCDQRTAMGKRDFAILLLLARLGLRAGEVRALLLDDIRWAEGVLVVRGKGSVISDLPLPADVGRALVAYLRVRGRPPTRSLFLRARAPFRGLGPATATQIIPNPARRRLDRAYRVARVNEGDARRVLARLPASDPRRVAAEDDLAEALRLQQEIEWLRPHMPTHAPVENTELADTLVRHTGQLKTIIDVIRVVCANAESDLAAMLAPHLLRPREAKKVVANLLAAPGQVIVTETAIRVRLAPAANRSERRAIAAMLCELSQRGLTLPGDRRRLPVRFETQLS